MSNVVELIQQPAPIVQVVQQPAMVVEVEMPSGVSSVDAPLTYDPVTQRLGFNPAQVTGLPPSATAGTAVVDADPRLSNARTPTAHKSTHATGGSDALTPADIGAEPAGTSAAGMASHLAASDPHPQYTTTAEAAAAAPVQSVAGKTGAVTLTPADAGADPAGTASAAVAAHVAAADPHSQYTTAARVRDVVLTGLSTATNAAIAAADSILAAFGKLQAQINAHFGAGGAAHADATTSAAGFMAAADKTKLDGIATGATANSTDAQLRDRATHTGSQAISTVSGLQTALDGKEAAGTASASMTAHLAAADPHSQYTTAAEAAAAAPVQSVAGKTGAITLAAADISDSTAAGRTVLTAADAAAQRTALGLAIGTDVQGYDADLQAIGALAGTAGLLRKTAANTWGLDTASYLTGNQLITVSGDATGSGATAITLTLANSGVSAGTYRSVTVDAKGRVTAGTNPTTLTGYGITDAQPLDSDLTAIAALTHAVDNFLVSNGTAWVRETPAEALVSLGLGTPTGTGNVVRATSPTISDATLNGQTRLAAGTAAAPALTTIGDTDTGVFFPAANTWAVATGASERLRLDSSGNLVFSSTAQRITGNMTDATVGNRLAFQNSVTNGSTIVGAIPNGTSVTSVFRSFNNSDPANAGQATFGINSGNAFIDVGITGTGAYLPLTFTVGASERMRITSGGNIAIGGTNAVAKLAVYDSNVGLVVLNTSDPAAATSAPMLKHPVASGFSSTPAFSFWYSNAGMSMPAAETLGLVTNNQERMRITSAGDVGIGTTSPTARLHVSGSGNEYILAQTTNTTGAAIGYVGAQYSNTSTIQMRAGQGYTYLVSTGTTDPMLFGTNGQERMRITSGGDVGIGTSAPGRMLTVSSSSDTSIQSISSGANSYIQATGSAGSVYFGAISTAFGVLAGGSERMRIKDTGQTRFVPLAADPAGAESGDVYYNSGTNKLRVYNGTAWVDLH